MDANKRLKLKEIGYSIRRNCRNCMYSVLENPPWGTCTKFRYQHLKHTDAVRDLSINMDGVCGHHEWSTNFLSSLGLFTEFLEKERA
jgi:hypothetical protein